MSLWIRPRTPSITTAIPYTCGSCQVFGAVAGDVKGDGDKVLKDATCFMLDTGQSLSSKKMNKKAAKTFAKLSKSFKWCIKGRNEESNHLDPTSQAFWSSLKTQVMNVITNGGGSSCLNFEPP